MAVAYNLTRLVYLGVEQDVEINFAGGSQVLAEAKWLDLETLYRQMTVARGRSRHLVQDEQVKT